MFLIASTALAAGTFVDDDGNTHEGNIEAIAAEGITKGCNPPDNDRYCPDEPVTRGQMAALLRRAFDYPSVHTDFFGDDDDSVFEGDIDAIAAEGITKGCNPPDNDRYCPTELVTRAQMASFLARALGLTPLWPEPAYECDYNVSLSTSDIDGSKNFAGVGPGDVICLAAGRREAIDVTNIHGSVTNPITIVNSGGVARIDGSDSYAGFEVENSSHLRITGTGSSSQCGAEFKNADQRCGIVIDGSEHGITGKVRTEGIEIDHVEIRSIGDSGVSIKDNEMGRGEWVLSGVGVTYSYFHDIADEGVYIGSSDYATGEFHVLTNVRVEANRFFDTGRDGIQIGSTTSNCLIANNVVARAGQNNESSHRAGVMNNKGSVCDIVGNLVVDVAGWGIYVQGNGGNQIYNNLVVRSGRLVSDGDGDGDGIAIHTGSNTDRSIYVWNNTVISARGDGIGFHNDVGTDNQIVNNLVVLAGGELISASGAQQVQNNLVSQSLNNVGFVGPANDNYRLEAASPAVDAGLDMSSTSVVSDHDGTPRPLGSGFDIGAFESH